MTHGLISLIWCVLGLSGGFWVIVFCAGTFERVIDDKQRLLLPKSVKKTFESGESLYLTPGFDRCLEIHNAESIERRALKVQNSTTDMRIQKSFSRLFFAQAEKCDLDSQNRIRVPQRLVDWAKLDSRIVVLGAGDVWEVWGERCWQNYCEQHQEDFDMVAQQLITGSPDFGDAPETESTKQMETSAKPK